MNKFLIATAATVLAIACFVATGANAAGFNVRLAAPNGFSNLEKTGCHGGRRAFRRHAIQSVRRNAQKKAYIARQEALARKRAIAKAEALKAAKAERIARAKAKAEAAKLAQLEADKPAETAAVAETQNSSITTAKGGVAAATESKEQKVAVAKELGCKQFFPSAGMTLSVPCE